MAEEIKEDKKLSQLVAENSEIAATFEQLEIYAQKKPDVFKFFMHKYQPMFFENMDLFYLLFGHFQEQSEGIVKKLFPYISLILMALTLLLVAFKK